MSPHIVPRRSGQDPGWNPLAGVFFPLLFCESKAHDVAGGTKEMHKLAVLWRKRHKIFERGSLILTTDRAAFCGVPLDPLEVPIWSIAASLPYNRPLLICNAPSRQAISGSPGRQGVARPAL
jgi:hypothetical protein